MKRSFLYVSVLLVLIAIPIVLAVQQAALEQGYHETTYTDTIDTVEGGGVLSVVSAMDVQGVLRTNTVAALRDTFTITSPLEVTAETTMQDVSTQDVAVAGSVSVTESVFTESETFVVGESARTYSFGEVQTVTGNAGFGDGHVAKRTGTFANAIIFCTGESTMISNVDTGAMLYRCEEPRVRTITQNTYANMRLATGITQHKAACFALGFAGTGSSGSDPSVSTRMKFDAATEKWEETGSGTVYEYIICDTNII